MAGGGGFGKGWDGLRGSASKWRGGNRCGLGGGNSDKGVDVVPTMRYDVGRGEGLNQKVRVMKMAIRGKYTLEFDSAEEHARYIELLSNKYEKKAKRVANALKVMMLDSRIRGWLVENDPKALQQAVEALDAFESCPDWSRDTLWCAESAGKR